MTFIQQWAVATSASTTGTHTRTGTAITAGDTVFIDLIVRRSVDIPDVALTDNAVGGSNVYTLVDSVLAGSARLFTYICRNAKAASSVTSTLTASGTAVLEAHTFIVSEHSPVGAVIAVRSSAPTDGGSSASITVPVGATVRVSGGVAASNRTWTLAETGVDLTARNEFHGASIQVLTSDGIPTVAGSASGGWVLATGSSINIGIIAVAFAEPVAVLPPVALGTVTVVNAATGWTPNAGTVLDALSDDDTATYVTGAESPDNQLLDLSIQPLIAPAVGLPAVLYLRGMHLTSPGSVFVTGKLYNGATLRATAPPVTLTAISASDVAMTFAAGDIGAVDWSSVRVVISFSAG